MRIPDETELVGFDDHFRLHFVTGIDESGGRRIVTVSVYRMLFNYKGEIVEDGRR